MADELQANLSSYKLQLQQVEAALTTDPDSVDLQKLKKDLQEVLDLTTELVKTHEQVTPTPTSDTATTADVTQEACKQWNVGDKCLAIWSQDQQSYVATIDEILEDGTCTITFQEWGNTDVTQVTLLRPVEEAKKREADDEEGNASKKPKTRRDKMAAEREYKKNKQQKKAQRRKQMEEERETEKNKWLDFNAKVFSKTSKGKVKKSIFATPDAAGGRVGVGTCGVSGKPMTQFTQHEKWKK